jgi:hypothetical protein
LTEWPEEDGLKVNKNYKGFFVVFNGLDVALVVIVRRY